MLTNCSARNYCKTSLDTYIHTYGTCQRQKVQTRILRANGGEGAFLQWRQGLWQNDLCTLSTHMYEPTVHTYVHMYSTYSMYVCTLHMYICTYVQCVYNVCTHIRMYVCMYCLFIWTYVCMDGLYIRIYVCAHIQRTYIHLSASIHTFAHWRKTQASSEWGMVSHFLEKTGCVAAPPLSADSFSTDQSVVDWCSAVSS